MNYAEDFLEIMKSFDFDRCLTAMKALDWEYYDGEPDIDRLEETVRDIYETLMAVTEDGEYPRSVTAGGFRIAIPYNGANLHLSFVIEYIDWIGSEVENA